MRPLRALGIYLLAIFLGGAVLAPWVWHAVQAGGPWLAKAASKPFARYVVNSMLIVAVLGLWPFFRALGAKSRREIGLSGTVENADRILKGVGLGLASLAPVVGLALLTGGRVWREGLLVGVVTGKLIGAVFTAGVVAFLEEILFRGGMFGALRKVFDWRFALIVSAVAYAGAHFLEEVNFQGPVAWYSGLAVLPRMWHGLVNLQMLVPALFTLTLAGALLALAYQRTGNLYFSIGLHAGWIFWLAAGRLFTAVPANTSAWFWGTDKLIDGWLACLALGITLVVYWRLPVPRAEGAYGWK